jgi:hypothetical protein
MIASISFGVRVRYLPPYGLPKRSHASHARAPQNISAVGSTDTTAEAGLWFQCREGVAVIGHFGHHNLHGSGSDRH